MTIGERIRQRRQELGLSVDDVAKRLGKNRATVYRYESDAIKDLPITIMKPLADVLDTTPADLMGWSDTMDALSKKADELLGVQTDAQPLPDYLNDETTEIANAVYSSSDLRILFDNSRKMKPEDLKVLIAMQEAILRKEKN